MTGFTVCMMHTIVNREVISFCLDALLKYFFLFAVTSPFCGATGTFYFGLCLTLPMAVF